MSQAVRRSPIAGSWYPGMAGALRRELDEHLAAVEPAPQPVGRLVALISPHAGLLYSGPVAAWGYSLLSGQGFSSVVLVGPHHRFGLEDVAVCAEGAWQTPLGLALLDSELGAALISCGPPLASRPEAHRLEHSLEMQVPFLQHLLPKARIVPVLMGTQQREECDAVAEALVFALAGRNDVLLVASSDLSHYHPAPVARRLDQQVLELLDAFDPEGLMGLLEREPEHACGGGPIVSVLRASKRLGATSCSVLRHADSGDAGLFDKSRVVGYVSAAVWAAG